MTILEKKIRQRAEEKNLALRVLAGKANMTEATLHSILKKGDAKLSQIVLIAQVLDTTAQDLITDAIESNSSSGRDSYKKIEGATLSSPEQETSSKIFQEKISLMQQLLESKDDQIQMLRQENARLRAELGKVDGGRDARQTG